MPVDIRKSGGMATCKYFHGVSGFEDRQNDIIVCGDVLTAQRHVLYFGGDIQDTTEAMEATDHNKPYLQWSLDRVAQLLHGRFSSSAVFVIRPAKMHLQTFSVFSNFVESSDFGNPSHSNNFGAIKHLQCLYTSILKLLMENETGGQTSCDEHNDGDTNIPISLVGFSKGCIVLNQIVWELDNDESSLPHLKTFLGRIKDMYWLDGGHSGGSNTWVINRSALKHLAELGCDLHVDVTPYQVRDSMRRWIGEEESMFVKILIEYKAKVMETLHFKDNKPFLSEHFKVLNTF